MRIYEVFEGKRNHLWYWHRIAKGNIVADGGYGYSTASNARRAARHDAGDRQHKITTLPKGK